MTAPVVKIIETPRDAFQGLKTPVPAEQKIRYINELLKAGFEAVEVGSFVSPKVIPQMKDTPEVLSGLDTSSSSSKIIVLVPNAEGARRAVKYDNVDQLLFPYSVSPTFLQRNLHMDMKKGEASIRQLLDICAENSRELIVYLTMGFGNPYGDDWSIQLVTDMTGRLTELGLNILPLSDILGTVSPDTIYNVFSSLTSDFPGTEFGAHLHARPGHAPPLLEASWEAGIRRFDTVLGGLGGCPMADDELVSNVDTLELIRFLELEEAKHNINVECLERALGMLNVKC